MDKISKILNALDFYIIFLCYSPGNFESTGDQLKASNFAPPTSRFELPTSFFSLKFRSKVKLNIFKFILRHLQNKG